MASTLVHSKNVVLIELIQSCLTSASSCRLCPHMAAPLVKLDGHLEIQRKDEIERRISVYLDLDGRTGKDVKQLY